ncbi:MAG: hypothetical protein J5861_00840 [Desulfovibrio sp.]|nr:hypothetical protein [Desulfovibrio sp.]
MAHHLDLHLCHGNISPVHTFLLRKTVVETCGVFNESLNACEDEEYWLRCAAMGQRFGSISTTYVWYVQHDDSLSGKRAHQHEHDIQMRFAVSHLLENRPAFPRAGKYLGRLAHAAGTLGSARGAFALLPDRAAQLLEECGLSLLRAMAEPETHGEETYLALTEEYYVTQFFSLDSEEISLLPTTLQKALNICKRRFPSLAALDAAELSKKRESLLQSLCCPIATEFHVPTRPQGWHAQTPFPSQAAQKP